MTAIDPTAPALTSRAATDATRASLERIATFDPPGIWISRFEPDRILHAAAEVDRRVAAGEQLPLAGITLAVKDNIDVAGLPTTAACPAYAYEPTASAPVVVALELAGAVVIGKTNLDQFATGLVGNRSPYGACPNPWWPHLIAGGSSSGSAAAVAAGHVDAALGTDTAGSGRVPAAATGLIGIKPTIGRLPTIGVVPAMANLDCVSVFADDLDLAATIAAIAAGEPVTGEPANTTTPTFALPELGVDDFAGDAHGPARHAAAVAALLDPNRSATTSVDLSPFHQVAHLLYGGAFVAERYAAVGTFVDAHPDDVDPIVGRIIRDAGRLPAWQLVRDQAELARRRVECDELWRRADVLVLPTVPRLPTTEELRADPLGTNTMLGRYTNFVNLLDLCALALPVPTEHDDPTGPPTSITLVAPAGRDGLLLEVARRLRAPSGTPANRRSG